MKAFSRFLLAASLLAVPAVANAQVAPDKALSTFKVHSEGLELSLWASEEVGGFCNPTCIDVDHKGRVWVCESVNYRHTIHRQPPRRPEGDRILILEDTKGEGKADKCTVFYQAPEILAPLGIAVAKDPVGPGYKVFVCQSPDILVFTDKEGKGKADGPPTKLLTGFNGIDHDHGVHGILIGPDMKLYFSIGDPGVTNLQSSDGKGRKFSSNNTDVQAGTIWRCELDGTKLELLADNFRNEYEPCVDSFGTIVVSDNDDDGNQQTRICYVMPGGNYGYHAAHKTSHWNEEQPGIVPKILRTYFGSPTGICVYEGTLLPKQYWGQPLHTDAGPREVRCYHLTADGAGYDVKREDMVTSTDNWFRPSDVCVAPDGSAYIADWYDPGVGGHGIGDFTRGRIYRLAPKGNKPNAPKVDLESKEGLTAALASPNLAVRYMAMAKMEVMKPSEAFAVLNAAVAQKENRWLRARASWQLARLGIQHHDKTAMCQALVAGLSSKDPDFNALAIRIAKEFLKNTEFELNFDPKVLHALDYELSSPVVRREFLMAARDDETDKFRSLIYDLAKQYDGKDRFYLEAVGIAVGHFDKARRDVILADFDKEFPQWNDKVADLVWELQPPAMLPTLGQRLADKSLTPAQRGRIVDILAVADNQAGGAALLKVLETDVPQEVRDKVIDNLKLFLPTKWQGLRGSKDLAESIHNLLSKPETRITGLYLIAAAEKIDALSQVEKTASDSKEADAIRLAAVQTLGALPSKESAASLTSLLAVDSPAIRNEAAQALGRLAQRKADQPGSTQALTALQNAFTNKDQHLALQEAAASALAGTRPGSTWLLQLAEKKQLPEALRNSTARLVAKQPLSRSAKQGVDPLPAAGQDRPEEAAGHRRVGQAPRRRGERQEALGSQRQKRHAMSQVPHHSRRWRPGRPRPFRHRQKGEP